MIVCGNVLLQFHSVIIQTIKTCHVETVVCLSNKNAKPKDYAEIGVDVEDWKKLITELLERARTGFWGIDEEICGRNKYVVGMKNATQGILECSGQCFMSLVADWDNLITIC